MYEYYAATEGGGTLATPEDWLRQARHGGQAVAEISEVMVADEDGAVVPAGGAGHRVYAVRA